MVDRVSHKIRFRYRGPNGALDPVVVRFLGHVAVGGEDECWEWQRARDQDGYGRFSGWNRHWRTHRLSWTVHHGPIPQGLYVLHSCDNPPCCNPAHLRLGTQRDNGADMKARGRCAGNGYHRRVYGDDVVDAIRAAVAAGELQKAVAARFGVSRSYVSALIRGRRRAGA